MAQLHTMYGKCINISLNNNLVFFSVKKSKIIRKELVSHQLGVFTGTSKILSNRRTSIASGAPADRKLPNMDLLNFELA
jgi:hypothetical protein